MPHKRAKRSVRESETKKKGYNNAPSSSSVGYDDAPRNAMRVLNSMSTQAAFRAKGGKSSEDTGERRKRQPQSGPSSSSSTSIMKGDTKGKDKGKAKEDITPKIMPHESLGDFNRRVESALRGGVSQAIKSANHRKTTAEKEAKRLKAEKAQSKNVQPVSEKAEARGTKRKHDVNDDAIEFASAPGPRRLNDIAQAPPSLPKLKVSGDEKTSVWAPKGTGKGKSGLSAGQERLMEIERERVIQRYREMKAAKEEVREKEREKEARGRGKSGKKGEGNLEQVPTPMGEYHSDDE